MDAARRSPPGPLIALLVCAGCAAQEFERGMEFARSGQWDEARQAFLAGRRKAPRDPRFLMELAGIEYRRKGFATARHYLAMALRLDPTDRYGNDFLGTLYFLDGNLEAALKYWNRIGKPWIGDVRIEPEPRRGVEHLDRALAFSPAAVLWLDEYRTTRDWLDTLDMGRYRLEIAAHADERFDATLHWLRPAGWMSALAMLRGLPYQTLQPEIHDARGSGVSVTGMLRWDAQKRRLATAVAGPLGRGPQWRYRIYADARRETWNRGAPQDFRMERTASGVEVQAIPSWRLAWRTGFEVVTRSFAGAPALQPGTSLKYRAALDYGLLRIPERRIRLDAGAEWDVGRMLSGTHDIYSRTQAWLRSVHLARMGGEDYTIAARLRAGTTAGRAPFDELFQLGVERDNDLWLRGHAGTRDGKKGSALMGGRYALANLDVTRPVYRHALFSVEAGPWVDTGRIHDARQWLVDCGVQVRVRPAGGWSVVVSYGRSLRGGGTAWYGASGDTRSSAGFDSLY